MPFPKDVRVAMFKRDNATCQWCSRRWEDGWMLHASHIKHNGNNSIKNGKMLCVTCHQLYHEVLFVRAKTKKERDFHAYAIRKLKATDVHNWIFYNRKKRGGR